MSLQDFLSQQQNAEIRVHSVQVDGIERTRADLIQRLVNPILASKNVKQVVTSSQAACDRLVRLGVVKTADVLFDSSGKDGVNVTLKFKEAGRIWAKTGTEVGNYQGNAYASMKLRNIFGAGEHLESTLSYGVETSSSLVDQDKEPFKAATGSAFQCIYTKPVDADPDCRLEFSGFLNNRSHALYSSHEEKVKGLAAKYKLDKGWGHHEFAYNLHWREIHSLTPDASWSIRQDAGHSLKSSLSHMYTFDSRNDSMLPTQGLFYKLQQELAGMGGNVQFAKSEASSQTGLALGKGFVSRFIVLHDDESLIGSLRGGVLIPFGGSKSRINDRFFLGGPLTVRGFRNFGVGPVHDKDAVGGETYWAGSLGLLTPLPYIGEGPMKGHVFVNAGHLTTLESVKRDPITCLSRPSLSVGLGLAVRFSMLRLELNYCLPISVRSTDFVQPGLQFGVGLEFL